MTKRIIVPPNGIALNWTPANGTYRFIIAEEADAATVQAYAIAMTPSLLTTASGLIYRQDVRINRTAYNQWSVEVPYAAQNNETGDWTWDFDTTGGTIHISTAKEEVARYPAGTAPNQLAAIAVDGDEVKGIDIVIPAMKINVTFRHPLAVVTLAYAKFLSDITGMVNSDTFLTFAPGEVLFLGARGSDGSEAEATVSYQFAMAKNQTGQTIGAIGGVAKKAWEVAWIRYEDTITSSLPTRVAKFVYVDRVYDTVAMAAAFGFGG